MLRSVSLRWQAIAANLRQRVEALPTYSYRLHVLYLVHDLLVSEAGKPQQDGLVPWVPTLKPSAAGAGRSSIASGTLSPTQGTLQSTPNARPTPPPGTQNLKTALSKS